MANKKKDKIMRLLILFAAFCLVVLTGYQILLPFLEKQPTPQIQVENNSPIENSEPLSNQPENLINEPPVNQSPIIINMPINNETPQEQPPKASVSLKVPFTSQAPFGVWDPLHNDACEEASIVIVDAYLKNKTLTPQLAEDEIQALVAWQDNNWHQRPELTVDQTAELAKNYFGYQNFKIQGNITIDDIKKELSLGNPVIVPLAGRLIGNPYYRQPGPLYHMLVISGYKNDKFITQDPGTRHGENYVYDQNVLYEAIHNWPGDDKNIIQGEKAMLIIEK